MNTITIDVSECLYYLVPIVIFYAFTYFLVKRLENYESLEEESYFFISIFTVFLSVIYFIVMNNFIDTNFIFKL